MLITGAAGQIAYSLIFMVARGDMFGPNKKVRPNILRGCFSRARLQVILHLLDIAPMVQAMQVRTSFTSHRQPRGSIWPRFHRSNSTSLSGAHRSTQGVVMELEDGAFPLLTSAQPLPAPR